MDREPGLSHFFSLIEFRPFAAADISRQSRRKPFLGGLGAASLLLTLWLGDIGTSSLIPYSFQIFGWDFEGTELFTVGIRETQGT